MDIKQKEIVKMQLQRFGIEYGFFDKLCTPFKLLGAA